MLNTEPDQTEEWKKEKQYGEHYEKPPLETTSHDIHIEAIVMVRSQCPITGRKDFEYVRCKKCEFHVQQDKKCQWQEYIPVNYLTLKSCEACCDGSN